MFSCVTHYLLCCQHNFFRLFLLSQLRQMKLLLILLTYSCHITFVQNFCSKKWTLFCIYEKSCWSHFNSPSLCRSSSSCWPASSAAASAPTSPDAASSPSTAALTPSGAAAPASGCFQILSLVNITASCALGPASAPSSRPPTCHTA